MRALRAWLVRAAAAAAALPVCAQDEAEVVSPRADSIAVTIYRDDLALITETRTVDLPAGGVTLVFEGVVETLLPQSAIVTDVARPLAESNFDFDRLTPRSLLERSIGETVTITRTNPATGRVTQTAATILAVGDGVVLRTTDGNEALYCSGLPERLELMRIPDELLGKPRLSVRLAAGEAGARTVKISYLAHGFAWSSDYVAHLNERSDAMRLAGWATLTNSTGTVFEQADVQLVAGRLNILVAEVGGSAAPIDVVDEVDKANAEVATLRECFATDLPVPQLLERMQTIMFDRAAPQAALSSLEEITLTASRAVREELGDYQLYRLPWRADLNARQTKQVLFLDEPAIRIERFYGLRLESLTEPLPQDVAIPNLIVRFENTEAQGLGEPLPRGVVRAFETFDGREVFAGEAEIADRPVGLPVELVLGRALNVMLEVTTSPSRNGARVAATTEHVIVNNKSVPIDLEIRHAVESYYTDVELESTSRPMRRKYGDLAWRFDVPPGEEVLRYRLSARSP
ncbi:MAG TPA: hypothetical protein VM692_05570 [Gammaproteobacteria bacterium]|nr:hypothetical protein [Gammaproteobacteria bacterium]